MPRPHVPCLAGTCPFWDQQAMQDPGDVASFLSRALDFGNGVSPTVPALFLGGALTYWGLIELWRVRHGPVALADPEVHRLINKAVYTDVEKMRSRWDLLNGSMLNVPPYGIATMNSLIFPSAMLM